jgi:hypothetical protein
MYSHMANDKQNVTQRGHKRSVHLASFKKPLLVAAATPSPTFPTLIAVLGVPLRILVEMNLGPSQSSTWEELVFLCADSFWEVGIHIANF